MAEAIAEMTAKGFGCVGITDRDGLLVGIITDGDLRRHMSTNLLDLRVEQVMTRQPKTVRPDQLVSEALEMLNSTKKTQLIVVDAGKPVGVVHFHDLLRAGLQSRIVAGDRSVPADHHADRRAADTDGIGCALRPPITDLLITVTSRFAPSARAISHPAAGRAVRAVTRQTVSSMRIAPTPSTIGLSRVNSRPT